MSGLYRVYVCRIDELVCWAGMLSYITQLEMHVYSFWVWVLIDSNTCNEVKRMQCERHMTVNTE